jgi:hypothetical protein
LPVQTNRASIDRFEENCIRRIPHPFYSPDLASGDFYLFATVTEKPERIQVADEDDLFERLQANLWGVHQQELNVIFRAWMRRVQEVTQGNGDDVR